MGARRNFFSHRDLTWGEEKYFILYVVLIFYTDLYWKCIY